MLGDLGKNAKARELCNAGSWACACYLHKHSSCAGCQNKFKPDILAGMGEGVMSPYP